MRRRGLLLAGSCAFCLAIRRAMALGGRRMHVDQVTGEMVPDNSPEVYEWMEKAYSQGSTAPDWHNAIHCCGAADAHRLPAGDDSWRRGTPDEMRNGILYQVNIEGIWYPIFSWHLLKDPMDHPNPTGQAVVWYGNGAMAGHIVYCFAPWEAML